MSTHIAQDSTGTKMNDAAMFDLAQERFSAGDTVAAMAIVDRLLATAPGDAAVLTLWMLILSKTDVRMEAITIADRLLQLDPAHVLAMTTKGRLLIEKGEKADGIALLEVAGALMIANGLEQEGCRIWQSTIELMGGDPLYCWVMLVTRRKEFLSKENLEFLCDFMDEIYAYKSNYWWALECFGCMFWNMGDLLKSLPLLKKSFALNPQNLEICNKIGIALSCSGRDGEAIVWFRKADDLPHDETVAYLKGRSIQYSGQGSQKELNMLWDRWGRGVLAHAAPRPPMPPAPRPLRLGFCSTMLGRQSVTDRLVLHLASALARRGIEMQLYITWNEDPAPLPEGSGYQWVNLSNLDYPERAQIIRNDRLHALIDLDWPVATGFLELYKYGPAPLVAGMLHSASSYGGGADCLIMDDWYCPLEAEADFSERILRTKETICWPFPNPIAPAVAPPPCLTQGFITFGSYNRSFKLDEATLAAWAEVVKRVPKSRLLLHSASFDDHETDRVVGILRQRGLAQERFEILRNHSNDIDFLTSYDRVDIALDPLHFNGGMTSLDALWQGAPVFACPGSSDRLVASRMGASLLTSIGRPEWIAQDLADWQRMVVDAASDYDRLQRWRFELRPQIARSIVCDAERRADAFLNAIAPVIDERYGGV